MITDAGTLQHHVARGWVEYGDFGAVGDGVADDAGAIAAAHAYANEHGLEVKADSRATYYLGGGECTAVIQTSTDFGTAHFLIDDTAVQNREAPVFEVRSSADPVGIDSNTGLDAVTQLTRGQQRIPVTLPTACLLVATNEEIRHFIRFGANQDAGAPQKDVFLVDAHGGVDPENPIIWDFDQVSTLLALPVDADELRISGGRFTTIANRDASHYTYYSRNLSVQRSNVIITGLAHEVTGEGDQGAPYGGFLRISQCANVIIKDCRFTGHKTYTTIGSAGVPVSMGSYDISVSEALNVSFVNCIQTNDINDDTFWGLFGSNYCKNILLDGCSFSRFDAHRGVYNVTIRNSMLGHMGVHAIGEGTVLIESTRILGKYLLQLRPDYGSTWRGDVIIRNSSFQPRAGAESRAMLIVGAHSGQHDFGYQCFMPERILIENLEIDDAHHPADDPGPVVFADFNPDRVDDSHRELFPYVITQQVRLKNVVTTSGRELRLSDNPYMFRDVTLIN